MSDVAALLLLLSSALGLTIGSKYLLANKFFPYHAQVAGKEWSVLDEGVRAIIVGMLKIIGGGFVTLSITMAWLSYAVWKGIPWAPWAILTIAAAGIGPAMYVAVHLRSISPGAKTPVVPLVAGLALMLFAVGLAIAALKP